MLTDWSEDLPITVVPNPTSKPTPGAPFKTLKGEPVTLDAAVTVLGTNTAYTGDIVYQFDFGDGTSPSPLVEVKSTGKVEVEHVYAQSGDYVGHVSVTAEGMTQPTVVPFDVTVEDPVISEPDPFWTITEEDGTVFDLEYTVTAGTGVEAITGLKTASDGSVTTVVGAKMGNVIYWIDMHFTLGSYALGNIYFGNILGSDEMSGVVIYPSGLLQTYTGELND